MVSQEEAVEIAKVWLTREKEDPPPFRGAVYYPGGEYVHDDGEKAIHPAKWIVLFLRDAVGDVFQTEVIVHVDPETGEAELFPTI